MNLLSGGPPQPFLCNPWSLLDTLVVVMSLVALGAANIPVTVLRFMRAFRVIRLFGRMRALKKMVSALTSSIVPMMNAFLILFIILSICACPHRASRRLSSRYRFSSTYYCIVRPRQIWCHAISYDSCWFKACKCDEWNCA